MADAAPAMALALVDGRALLTVAGRDLGLAVVERLEVEWPEVKELPAAAADGDPGARVRNRRGRLRIAKLVIERARLEGHVAGATATGASPAELEVALKPGEVVVTGKASGNGQSGPFSARLTVGAGDGRKLRLSLHDLGNRDGPALAALAAMLGAPLADREAFEIDPIEAALDEILVAEGYRLPEATHVRLAEVKINPRRVVLSWAAPELRPDAPSEDTDQDPEPPPASASEDEIASLKRALALAPDGPGRAEVAHLLAAAYERAGQEDGAVDALRLCIDHAGAGPLVGIAWRRLVELYARRGDPQSAARALIACADDPRVGASEAERAGALVAAAEILRKRLNLPGDASMLLERAIALDPGSAEALDALEALTVEARDFERLSDVLERKLEFGARGPREQKALLLRLAEIYDSELRHPELARRTHERLLKIEPDAAGSRAYLARHAPPASPALPTAEHGETAPPTAERAEPPPAGQATDAPPAGGERGSAYWRAVAEEPVLRANHLIASARKQLAQGETQTAVAEIEAALALVPAHVGALALWAELCYRQQDWERARALYAALDAAPDTADVIARETLVQRRATLAARLGDAAEAETLYRELAILNPHQAEARRALAELALARGDLATGALRLEEVLRLLPLSGAAELGDLRNRLGGLYAELGQWTSARYYLELVLAQEPTRVPALEQVLEVYDKLGLPEKAAETCARLARLYTNPAERAGALYRQAEILRTALGDEAGALDAYLRSSDVDPKFVPARLRLIDHFWALGDVDVVADLANDLSAAPLTSEDHPDVVARLAIATAGPRSATPPRFALANHPALLTAAARVLALAGDEAVARGTDTLDPLLTRARFWLGADGEAALVKAFVEMVLGDPGRAGPALALGGLAVSTRRPALARAAYSLPAFVDPNGLGGKHLETMAAAEPVRAEALRVGSGIDHPEVAGPARRALAKLAPVLLGFGTDQAAPKPVEGSGLPPARAVELRRIAALLGAPPFVVAPDADAASKAAAPPNDRRRLRLVPSQPAGLLISASAARLSPRAWSFVAGRAIEALRSGLVTAGLNSADEMARLFRGARAALKHERTDDPAERAVGEWLSRPESATALGGAEARAELLADVEAALGAIPDWPVFRRGTRHTCNRIGLLVCGSPAEALAVVAEGEIPLDPGASISTEDRRIFVRGATARELITFLFSPAYEAAAAT